MAEISTLYIKIDSTGVVTASKNLKGLKTQADSTTKSTDKLTTSTSSYNSTANRTVSTLNKASSGFKTVGRDISRYGLLIAGAATATVKFSTDLTKGLGQVETLIPGTGDRIYELKDSVNSLATETGVAMNSLTAGLYQTISAFQDTADTEEIFAQATKAAVAGAASVSDSIELASAVTKAYGDTSAEATGKVFDLAFETVRLGQTTFPQLANGIQTATDSAVRLGVSQEELFATFSALTGVIGDASEVATKFRSASASLLNPNEKLLDLFDRVSEATGKQVTTGEDFVDASGGFANALKLIIDTAADGDEPFQSYIRRIEGITIASRLSGDSIDKYRTDLQAMYEAVGASDQAFETAISGIDEFRQSMLRSKNEIIVATTEIGTNLVPRVAELAEKIAGAATWFSTLDASIQNTVINFGALVVVLDPTLIAFGSLLRAIQLIQALNFASTIASITAVIGTGGLVVALAAVAGGIALLTNHINNNVEAMKQQKELQATFLGTQSKLLTSYDKLSASYGEVNGEQLISLEMAEELKTLYPELAGDVDLYTMSIIEAKAALVNLDREETARSGQDLFASEVSDIEKYVEDYNKVYRNYQVTLENIVTAREEYLKAIADGKERKAAFYLEELNIEQGFKTELAAEKASLNTIITDLINSLNEKAEEFGIEAFRTGIGADFNAILVDAAAFAKKMGLTLDEVTPNPSSGGGDAPILKTWQEWFEEVTGVAKESFGNLGAVAAQNFADSLQQSFAQGRTFSQILGEEFDAVAAVEEQQDLVREAFRTLAAIPEEEIKDAEIFKVLGINAETTDNAMRGLTTTSEKLNQQWQTFSELAVYKDLENTKNELTLLGKAFPGVYSEVDILEEKLAAQQKAFDSLTSLGLDPYDAQMQEVGLDLMTFEALLDRANRKIEEQEESVYTLRDVWNDYKDDLANLGLDALSDTFYELGNVLGDSSKDMDDFADAMNNVLKSILDALPAMFIQAGLQAIIAGNMPLGVGLIAAGMAGSFAGGYVDGVTAEADETNAHGAVYSYAKGGALGSFENSIVNTPTRFANGAGLMGEAGAEAIMPLTRTSSGDLGVATVGGGSDANVDVTVINNTGQEVTQQETTNADGSKQLEIVVGRMMNQAIATGQLDKSLNSSYGLSRRGY